MAVQLGSAYGIVKVKDEVSPNIKQAQKSVDGFGKQFKGLSTVIAGSAAMIGAEVLLLKKAFDFGKEGAQLDYARDKFDNLAESIGTTGDALMRNLKAATKGLVADSTLVASAGDLMELGLAKTHEEAVRLTRVAGALGMNMNQLVLTLTNQTTMRFDALGVSVDGFEEKVDKLKATGMDASRVFGEAFLSQAEEQLAKVGDVADNDVATFMRFEASVKNLTDSIKSGLYPTLLKAVEAANLLLTANQQIEDALAQHTEEVLRTAGSYEEYIQEVIRAAEVANLLTKDEARLFTQFMLTHDSLDALGDMTLQEAIYYERLAEKTGFLTRETWGATKATEEQSDELRQNLAWLHKVERGAEQAAEAERDLNQAMSDLRDMVAGDLGEEMDDYTQSQIELREAGDELRANIDEVEHRIGKLEGKKYLSKAQKNELEDLREELEGLKGDLDENGEAAKRNADAHKEATRRIMFDILMQRAAIGGLTDAEYNALMTVAEAWGLIDEDTRTAMGAADEFFKAIDEGVVLSQQKIMELDMRMRGLPTAHTFTVTVNTVRGATIYDEEGDPIGTPEPGGTLEPGLVPGGAHGLHGFIPPGYPNDSFLVAATSGERVDITPAGQIGGAGGNQVINQHFYNAGAAALGLAFVETLRGRRLDASMGR